MWLSQQIVIFALASTTLGGSQPCSSKQNSHALETLPLDCTRQARHVVVCTRTVTINGKPSTTTSGRILPTTTTTRSVTKLQKSTTQPQSSSKTIPASTTFHPTARPSPAPQFPKGGSGGVSNYMSVVSDLRYRQGLPPLERSLKLESNAAYALTLIPIDGKIHHLFPGTGSYAQVFSGGHDINNFREAYIGWLCEIPALPGLEGLCPTMKQSKGSIGHAEALSNIGDTRTKIGCAYDYVNNTQSWMCDLNLGDLDR